MPSLGSNTGYSSAYAGRRAGPGWAMVFIPAMLLFAATANRGPQWQDSGDIILRTWRGELHNFLGLALVHPLHYWLGRAALRLTFLEPAFAITLVSSLGAALAVANVYGCVIQLTGRIRAALFAAGSLAVANTFWHLATLTEVYTLTAALLAAELWCLAAFARSHSRRVLWMAFLFNGLGVGNHLQAGLTTPVLAVLALHAVRRRWLTGAAAAVAGLVWLAGSLPYTSLVAREMMHSGEVLATLRSALVGSQYGGNVLNTHLSWRLLGISIGFVLLNFPNLLLPAAVYGLWTSRQLRVPAVARHGLLAGLILHTGFVLRYNVEDQFTFFLPAYVFLCVFGGLGAAAMLNWPPRPRARAIAAAAILLALTPPAYVGVTAVARRTGFMADALRHKPYRDDYEYLLIPWSVAETSAAQLSRHALALAGDSGMILIEDRMARFAIEYQALRARRDRLHLVLLAGRREPERAVVADQVIAEAAKGRPIVLVPRDVDQPYMVVPGGRWERQGDLYVLALGGGAAGVDEARP